MKTHESHSSKPLPADAADAGGEAVLPPGATTGEFRGLTAPSFAANVRGVTLRPEADRFLRAAIKAGLRLQRNALAESGEGAPSAGVRTLQRIKASLGKRNINRKTKP
jgi:hypothetical protein